MRRHSWVYCFALLLCLVPTGARLARAQEPAITDQEIGDSVSEGAAPSPWSDCGSLANLLLELNIGNSLFAAVSPTGDALFDRYALEVERRMQTSSVKPSDFLESAVIPDVVLATWQQDFGSDPRYWELRYFCATSAQELHRTQYSGPEPIIFLRDAQQRGVASANILLILYCELREQSKYQDEETAPGADRVALLKAQEQEQLALLNAAVEAGPDEAWPYYLRAMYWFELGSSDLAQADLRMGNAAPKNVFPNPWPVNYAYSASGMANPPGSATVIGAILTANGGSDPVDFWPIFEHLKEAIVCDNLSGRADLEAWHQFACRISQSNSSLFNSRIGWKLNSVILDYLEESKCGPDNYILQHCKCALRETHELYTIQKTLSQQYSPEILSLFGLLEGNQGYFTSTYLFTRIEYRYASAMQGIMADLSQVDYSMLYYPNPELHLPPCMLKYRSLEEEQIDGIEDK